MAKEMKLSEYAEAVKSYEDAYEAGLTTQLCTLCDRPVIERDANWDFWPGSGVILHPECVRFWYIHESAATYIYLAVTEFLSNPRGEPGELLRTNWSDYLDTFLCAIGVPVFHLGFPTWDTGPTLG